MSTAKKLLITDNEISQILSMREMKKKLAKKLDKIEKDLKRYENEMMDLIDLGCDIDSVFNISISESSKTYPKYKEELEERLGEDVVLEIIENTEPKIFKKLIISE